MTRGMRLTVLAGVIAAATAGAPVTHGLAAPKRYQPPKTAQLPAPAPAPVVPPPVQATWADHGCAAAPEKQSVMAGLKKAGSAAARQWKKVINKYTVNGANGKYLCQVSSRKIDPGVLNNPTTRRTFSSDSRGEYQDRQLDLPATTVKLQHMLDTIAAEWPGVKPQHVVVRIAGTSVYQAEALPDNSIKVHMGLLTQAKSESEIAFILAHEYAHIVLGHLNRNDSIQAQNKLISTLADGYYYGTKLSQQEWSDTTKALVVKDQAAIDEARMDAADRSQQLRMVLDVAVTPVWKRSQEDEADTLGYDLATRAGFNAAGASGTAFQNMAKSEGEQKTLAERVKADLDASLKAAAEKQAKAVATLAAEDKLNAETAEAAGEDFWTSFNKNARDSVFASLHSVLTRSHRSPEERMAGLEAYSTAAYGDGGSIRPVAVWLPAARATPEFTQASIVVSAVDAASAARERGDVVLANQQMAKLAKNAYANTPMVLNETARIRVRERKYADADKLFEQAHGRPGQSVAAYQDHVDLLLTMRRWALAETKADKAVEVFGDRKPFLPAYVTIAFGKGEQDKAVNTLVECVSTENVQLKQSCVNNSPHPEDPMFKRLTPSNQERVMLARNKVNNRKSVDQAQNILDNYLKGTEAATKDNTPE